jgi:hypothetical protein
MEAIESIYSQVSRFEHAQAAVQQMFGNVDTAAIDMLTHPRVSPGGGGGAY